MSQNQDSSLNSLAVVAVAILLLLILLIAPIGFGLFYLTRQQAQYQRAVVTEQEARLKSEMARARQEAAAQAQTDQVPKLTVSVSRDGSLRVNDEVLDLEKLSELVAENSTGKAITLIADAECPDELLGQTIQRCLEAGAESIHVRRQ